MGAGRACGLGGRYSCGARSSRNDVRIGHALKAKAKALQPNALSVRNVADVLRLMIEAQLSRCTEPVPGDPFDADPNPWMRSMAQRGADLDLLVVALFRFRRLAQWALGGAFVTAQLHAAVAKFDAAVPNLTEIRHTQEHFDEYRSNVGKRQKAGEPASGFGYGLSVAGGIVTYGQFKLDVGEAVAAAKDLHRAIRREVDPIASQDVHGGPDTVLIPGP